jgi:hypothetical protein
MSVARRSADVLAILVNIYGSKASAPTSASTSPRYYPSISSRQPFSLPASRRRREMFTPIKKLPSGRRYRSLLAHLAA